jgi:hypothetical protein
LVAADDRAGVEDLGVDEVEGEVASEVVEQSGTGGKDCGVDH